MYKILERVPDETLYTFVKSLTPDTTRNFYNFVGRNSEGIKAIVEDGRQNFFVQLYDGAPITAYGFLKTKVGCPWIVTFGLVVADNYQGKGYGKLLLDFMIHWAKERNITKIWGSVFYDNEHAIKLYKDVGFVCEGCFLNEVVEGSDKFRHLYSIALYLPMRAMSGISNWSTNPQWYIERF